MSDRVRRTVLWNAFLYLIALILALKICDVKAIGPESATVGLARINAWFRGLFGYDGVYGYSAPGYILVRVLFFVSVGVSIFWAVLFIREMVMSGRADGVGTDKNLAATFFLYILTLIVCILFRFLPVNYGPALLADQAKPYPSFPAAGVLWIMIAMGSTVFHVWDIFSEKKKLIIILTIVCCAAAFLGVIGGLICGVYWLTDILGAILCAVTLLMLYSFFFFI